MVNDVTEQDNTLLWTEHKQAALYLISNYNYVGFKYHEIRNAIEATILLLGLLLSMPLILSTQ